MYLMRDCDECEKLQRLQAELARLTAALQATIAEKERVRQLAVNYSCKVDSYRMDLEMCQNMKLAREFEELLGTTDIAEAVEKVRELIAHKKAFEEVCRQFNYGNEKDYENMRDAFLAEAREMVLHDPK